MKKIVIGIMPQADIRKRVMATEFEIHAAEKGGQTRFSKALITTIQQFQSDPIDSPLILK